MKWLRVGLAIFVAAIAVSQPASALEAGSYTPPPNLEKSPVIITAYQISNGLPSYIELHNTASTPVKIDDWRVEYVVDGQADPLLLAELSGWIAPSNYILIANEDSGVDGADFAYAIQGEQVAPLYIRLVPVNYAPNEVELDDDGAYRRKASESTGNYLSTFASTDQPFVYGGGFYTYPEETPLQFTEILANPSACSPLDTSLACVDYVKLYNPSSEPVDLSSFRLRVGYKGQTATASNNFVLEGEIAPGHYKTIAFDAMSKPISISNGGGYVWLEDTYGIKQYDSTVQQYANASSDKNKGQAWAYDANDGKWKWTTQPTPADKPSVFPKPVVEVKATVSRSYAPCKPGQYRSKETNRCRKIASATASSSLKPCAAGQVRNPETNRCRKIVNAASQALKPCAAGQERNPETNRCRKIASTTVPDAAFAVEPVTETGKAFAGWWALGGITTMAAGYGMWEWREEMLRFIKRIGSFFTSGK